MPCLPTIVRRSTHGGRLPNGHLPYFMLAEVRDVGEQPPDPVIFTQRLAKFHRKSSSPDGKFGFRVPTPHAKLTSVVEWEQS